MQEGFCFFNKPVIALPIEKAGCTIIGIFICAPHIFYKLKSYVYSA